MRERNKSSNDLSSKLELLRKKHYPTWQCKINQLNSLTDIKFTHCLYWTC